MNALRWGLFSTANIGVTVVGATKGSEVTDFVAVASRDDTRAREFADGIADAVSEAILTGASPVFGRDDAVAQARALDAVRLSAEQSEPVEIN